MTPSGWHDDTRSRDAGHDEMQINAWKWLRDNGSRTLSVPQSYSRETDLHERWNILVEQPFIADGGKIICFADIAEIFAFDEPIAHSPGSVRRKFYYRIFEVKPKIYSVGGLLRQCTALQEQIKAWRPNRQSYESTRVWVVPLVRADDEKLQLLKEVTTTLALWDGDVVSWWSSRQ